MGKEATEKKKKSLVDRMIYDSVSSDFSPAPAHESRWTMFKNIFFGKFGTIVLLNILTLVFALPAVAVMVLFFFNNAAAAMYIPYSGNIGIGYPIVTDAVASGEIVTLQYTIFEFLILVPCIMFFALGVGANLYVMRKLMWEEETKTIKDFFRGIKQTWLGSLFMGIAIGMSIFLFVFSLYYFDVYGYPVALKVVMVIISTVILVFMSLFASYYMTQNAAFKLSASALLRNSFLFVIATHIQAIIFVAIALIPMFIAFIPGAIGFVAFLYVFIGFSFTTLVLTLYCHSNYEHSLYNKATKAGAVYGKRPADDDTPQEQTPTDDAAAKKRAATPYKNPKKRRKSIDEGTNITPLAPTFRREDLERLQHEHERIFSEEEQERTELEDGSDGGTGEA